MSSSCELISNCIFTWGFTRNELKTLSEGGLWIDFKLYFYVRIHKCVPVPVIAPPVVNWFQIVFLREDSQAKRSKSSLKRCCELISNCIFTWGFTSHTTHNVITKSLWIDFKLYFYVRIHKTDEMRLIMEVVVNWFQIVFLREDSQEQPTIPSHPHSCELISNCIFTWGFTSAIPFNVPPSPLWIDFKLYFYVRIHK